jgi:twitching motility protein PilT
MAALFDQFIVQLYRYGAQEVVLESNQPATLRLGDEARRGKGIIEHRQLIAMVKEVASRETLLVLDQEKRAEFGYAAGGEPPVRIVVDASEGRLLVRLAPASSEAATAAGEPGPNQQRVGGPSPESLDPRPLPDAGSVGAEPGTKLASGDDEEEPPPSSSVLRTDGTAPGGIDRPIVPGTPQPIDRYLRALVKRGGSDLHLSAGEVPMARLSGSMKPLLNNHPPFTDAQVRSLLMAIMTPRAREAFDELSDADFAYSIEGLARFRANYFDSRRGIGAVFRQIPYDILAPESLGLPKAVLDLCWLSKGLVVVTGPTGSGKSTTLASLIDHINQHREDHIVTIEDPIEFVHQNKKCLVTQREVGTHTHSFKNALRAALREDPDIVLVGEMRDLETIAIAIETAETGHLVFGTLHTTTAASTVDRIIDQFPADRQSQIRTMLSESLRGVIAQVLCKKVGGGRVGAYEVLITNPAVSNLIREGKTYQLASVMQTGKTHGMQTLNDHLVRLVKSKQVAPKEAYIKSTDKTSLREALEREGIQVKLD